MNIDNSNYEQTNFFKHFVKKSIRTKGGTIYVNATLCRLLHQEIGKYDHLKAGKFYVIKNFEPKDSSNLGLNSISRELSQLGFDSKTSIINQIKDNVKRYDAYEDEYARESVKQEIDLQRSNYRNLKHHYSNPEYRFTAQQIVSKAIAHSILIVAFDNLKFQTRNSRIYIIYCLLLDEQAHERKRKESNVEFQPAVIESFLDEIKLTSFDSFLKWVKRKKKAGLPKGLIHGLINETSNHQLWTDILKMVIILFAIAKPTHSTPKEIEADLLNLIEDYPEIKEHGVVEVSYHSISKFLREEGKAYISFAKDDPLNFQRKITGTLSFLPPSSPLVKMLFDGYVFQCVSADDIGGKPMQLVGVVGLDSKTLAALGVAIGDTENSDLILQCLREVFAITKGMVPREIGFDGHLAYRSKKMSRFLEKLTNDGVYFRQSKTPNYQGRLERAFYSFQGDQLKHVISYIGPGIKSKGLNAHPSRVFKVVVRSKEYLKDKQEMIRILYHLFRKEYNQGLTYRHSTAPMSLFREEPKNGLKVYSEAEIAYMISEHHHSTIVGSSVLIKHNKLIYIYTLRKPEIAKLYSQKVDVFVDPDKRQGVAYVFFRGTDNFLDEFRFQSSIPEAEFDRTEDSKKFLKLYSADTRKIIDFFEEDIINITTEVTKLLKGEDYRKSMTSARVKKRADGQYLGYLIGLSSPKKEPEYIPANLRKGRRKRRTNDGEIQLGLDLFDTF